MVILLEATALVFSWVFNPCCTAKSIPFQHKNCANSTCRKFSSFFHINILETNDYLPNVTLSFSLQSADLFWETLLEQNWFLRHQ